MNFPILSLLIFLPFVIAVVMIFWEKYSEKQAKYIGLIGSIIVFFLSLLLLLNFDITDGGMQFNENLNWIESFNIQYYLAIDGISLPLILLTTLMTPIAILSAWQVIQYRTVLYHACFLFLEGCIIGVFSAVDAILFYVFWEALLIPMFLVIGIWGGEKRVYATIKFFLFTFAGSVFMLLAFIYLYFTNGSFSILEMHRLPLTLTEQQWIFWAFFLAFAVKIPMIPVHTWLPDAHVEAPTAGSIILAAILLKLGGYGFIRFSLPIVPDAAMLFDDWIIVLSLLAIIYIAFVALVQKDMKKLIAYSSISHMGFVTLGLFVVFALIEQNAKSSDIAISGAIVQMISHGFISAALFMAIGVLYDRVHSRQISDYGGIASIMPKFAFFIVLFAMANAGLPGTSGFVGEFMIIIVTLQNNFWYALAAGLTLIVGAAYTLWMVKRVFYGMPNNKNIKVLKDLDSREKSLFGILAFFVILFGFWPEPLTNLMHSSIDELIAHISESKIPLN